MMVPNEQNDNSKTYRHQQSAQRSGRAKNWYGVGGVSEQERNRKTDSRPLTDTIDNRRSVFRGLSSNPSRGINTMTFQAEVDAAHRIVRAANMEALNECKKQGFDAAPAYQSLIQESIQRYAELLGSDIEAIEQIRSFLDDWESEATQERTN